MLRCWSDAKVEPRVATASNTRAARSGHARRSSVQVSVTRVPPATASKRYSQLAIGVWTRGAPMPMATTRNAKRRPGSAAVWLSSTIH